jgi:hypothetical protein
MLKMRVYSSTNLPQPYMFIFTPHFCFRHFSQRHLFFDIFQSTFYGLTRISPIRLSPTGHSPMAKVHCTFSNTLPGLSPIGECPPDFRQYTLMTFAKWRESTLLLPIHPSEFRQLANVHRTFASV